MSQNGIYFYISLFANIVFLGLIIYYGSRIVIYRHFNELSGKTSSGTGIPADRYDPENSDEVKSGRSMEDPNDSVKIAEPSSTAFNNPGRGSLIFDAILDHIPSGVMVIDHNRRILKINESLLNLFYLERDKTIGERTIFVFNNRKLEDLISGACPELKPMRENIVFYREEDLYIDVEIIPIVLNGMPGAGGNIAASGTKNDNSHYTSINDKRSIDGTDMNLLVLMNNITGEMEFSKLRSQFVANVSHEMRTPLTSIRGYLETLAETGIMDDRVKAKSYLDRSLGEVEKLNVLIKDVLDLSRIEYRRNVLFKDRVNLVDIIKSSIDFLDFLARKNNTEIMFKHSQDPVYLNTDEELFQQMARNLMENAVFHAGNGARLDINLAEEKDSVVLEFKDNGTGISREDQPFIFQRFYRGRNTPVSKRTGSGLGLAIVKHTVELHGGEIKVESEPGKGTCFRITFPKKDTENRKNN